MKIPDGKNITLTFVSEKVEDVRNRWVVNLILKGDSKSGDFFEVLAEYGNGCPIESGTYEIAGVMIPINAGAGRLLYDDFIAGKHERGIWMRRPEMPIVAGLLTFA